MCVCFVLAASPMRFLPFNWLAKTTTTVVVFVVVGRWQSRGFNFQRRDLGGAISGERRRIIAIPFEHLLLLLLLILLLLSSRRLQSLSS